MTVDLYDAVSSDGLFDIQGAAFSAQTNIQTLVNTTAPADVASIVDLFNNVTPTSGLIQAVEPVGDVVGNINVSSAMRSLSTFNSELMIELFDADVPLTTRSIEAALTRLIEQMEDDSDTVKANTVTAPATADAANTGNGVIVTSTKRGDGLTQQNIYDETLTIAPQSNSRTPGLSVVGEPSVGLLDATWPKGSGASTSISPTDTSSKISNGTFAGTSNVLTTWVATTATAGTTLKITSAEVQTITVTGTPTSGTYRITVEDANGNIQITSALAYNANGSAVQTALRALTGFSSVTVSSAGTTPDFTHTITFSGVGANIPQVIITNDTNGTITPATTTHGSGNVFYGGQALEIDSDGAETTTIYQKVTGLESATPYAFSMWIKSDVLPLSGVMKAELTQGIGASIIADDQGTDNAITVNGTSMATSWNHISDIATGESVFRTPTVLPATIYLRIRFSTAINNASSVYLSHAALAEMTELYDGGPYAAAFTGSVAFSKKDRWTIGATNNRAGKVQEWYNRNFNMANLGLLLPYASSPSIPESVIA